MDKINTQITVCHCLVFLLYFVVSCWSDIQEPRSDIEMGTNLLTRTIIPIPIINLPSVTYPTILTSDNRQKRNYVTQFVTFINAPNSIEKVKNLTVDDKIIAESKLSRVQLKSDEHKETIQQNGQRNSLHNYHQLKDGIHYKPMANSNQKLSSSEATIKEQKKSGHEIKEEHNHTEEESGEKDKKEHDEIYHTDFYQRDQQKNYDGGFKSENKNQKQRVEKGYFREFHRDEHKKLDKFFSNHHMGGEFNKYGIVKENDQQNKNRKMNNE